MPDELSVVNTRPDSEKKKFLLVFFLLFLSLAINGYFGYLYFKNANFTQEDSSTGKSPINSTINPLNILPVNANSKTVENVKVTYQFGVNLTNVASESAGLKIITKTPNGSIFDYDVTSKTRVKLNNNQADPSFLKAGQNLLITSEYFPKTRDWQTLEVNIQ